MSQRSTRVLLIEDEESDYLLTRRMLSSIPGRYFDLEWVTTYQTGLDAIRRAEHDVCLLDYRITGGDGLELLRRSRDAGVKAPVILLTGLSDYRLDVEAMQLGAADFLVKDNLTAGLLERSIRYAMAQALTLQEIQRQQDELRASELRFRSVVQSANDAIVLTDESTRIIFWNRGAETVFGYKEDEVLGFPVEALMPESYRPAHRAGLERLRRGGKAHLVGKTVEMEGLRKDGSVFPLELSLASWTTAEGTFFTGIIRDATERKHAEEMRCAKEAAEEASRAKSSFVARMSHELRTPLHAIIGFTNILLQNRDRGSRDADFLERILLNAKDQLRLINRILDISKIEAGKLDVEVTTVRLDCLVRDVIKQLEVERPITDVKVMLRIPDFVEPVGTDPAILKQVIVNLVDNALKFTDSGAVTVSILTRPGSGAPERIEVTDTGAGISPDELATIFEPFRQAETSATRRVSGTGLGLAISRSLCELLGYRLDATSQPGHGSTFSIVFMAEAGLQLTA
jgi:PAS domain S-box-containing protein